MTCSDGKSHFPPFRGRSARALGVGVLCWFVLCCVHYNTHLLLGSASSVAGTPPVGDAALDAETRSPAPSSGAVEGADPEASVSSSPRGIGNSLLPAANEVEVVHNGNEKDVQNGAGTTNWWTWNPFSRVHNGSEKDVQNGGGAASWWTWNPFSIAKEWIGKILNKPADRSAVPEVGGASSDTPDTNTTTEVTNTPFRSLVQNMASLFRAPSLTAALDPSDEVSNSVIKKPYYPNQCSAAVCREIALRIQTDMNFGVNPCSDVNEYYCGNWMRRAKELHNDKIWITYMDPVIQASTSVLETALEHLSCPADAEEQQQLQQQPEKSGANEVELDQSSSSEATKLSSPTTQDKWDSVLACSYKACMDRDSVNARGARPLFAAMFDSHRTKSASLRFLLESNFEDEVVAAGKADRLVAKNVETALADTLVRVVDSLVVAAGGSPADASAATAGSASDNKTNVGKKNLLRILVPRLQSIYGRMNAQFFWSLLTSPHGQDDINGQTLTIADMILGLPYHQFDVKYADRQLSYKRYLGRLLRAFDTQLAQYRREIYDAGLTSNSNMKLPYAERARRIFNFEAKVLRQVVLSPEELEKLKNSPHTVTFGELKKSTEFLDVETLVKIYMQGITGGLFDVKSHTPSFATRWPTTLRSLNGIAIKDNGELVLRDDAEFTIYQKKYFSKLEKVLYDPKNWAVLHDYILVKLIHSHAEVLSEDFSSARDEFLTSMGQTPPPRSRLCLQAVPKWLLGRLYVQRTSSQEKKAVAKHILENLKSAFSDAIQQSVWMDAPTQKHALRKLAAMTYRVGYPDWLLNATKSQGYFEKYYGNSSAALAAAHAGLYEFMDHMRRQHTLSARLSLGAPRDPEEWEKAPHEVHGLYSEKHNEFLITAALLQKPMMFTPSSEASAAEIMVVKAVNYGGLAAYIGHELAHAFDSRGSQYDGEGQLNNWWSRKSKDAFAERLQCLRDQYSNYFIELEILPPGGNTTNGRASESSFVEAEFSPDSGSNRYPKRTISHDLSKEVSEASFRQHPVAESAPAKAAAHPNIRRNPVQHPTKRELFVDGENTAIENFGDNVGLQMAWAAFRKQLTAAQLNEEPIKSLGFGLTIKQIFLFAWGHSWCEVPNHAALVVQVLTKPYMPARFRSQGALANFPLFAEEYQCPTNTPLNPERKCKAW